MKNSYYYEIKLKSLFSNSQFLLKFGIKDVPITMKVHKKKKNLKTPIRNIFVCSALGQSYITKTKTKLFLEQFFRKIKVPKAVSSKLDQITIFFSFNGKSNALQILLKRIQRSML